MSANNPQHNYMGISKKMVTSQDILEYVALLLAFIQGIFHFLPSKIFLTVTGIVLILEYLLSYLAAVYFDKGNSIREKGLLDNSFQEKRIPNYNSEEYYNNSSIDSGYIKLLANTHENALFTSKISTRMSKPYFIVSVIAFLFLIKIFLSGMDDYSSVLLSFIVSSNLFKRAINIHSLKKITEDIYDKANDICNSYEKNPNNSSVILSNILELLLIYENAIFESKIILNQRLFDELNHSLSEEWEKTRDTYSIYKRNKEINK